MFCRTISNGVFGAPLFAVALRGAERIRAQIALPFILLVSGIIIEIVVAGSLTSYFASGSGLGMRLESQASAAASSGINDALMRLTKNKDFGATNPSYGVAVGSDAATVTFTLVNSYYTYTVTSLGTAGTRQKKAVATIIVASTTGAVALISLNEVPVQ